MTKLGEVESFTLAKRRREERRLGDRRLGERTGRGKVEETTPLRQEER